MTKIKKALLSVLCCFALIFCSAFVFTACTKADMKAYNITIDEAIPSGCSVKVIGDPIAGEEITIIPEAGEGYEYVQDSLKVNGKIVINNKFVMPEGNINVTARFKKINYAVNIGNVEHGTIDIEVDEQNISTGDKIEWGTKVTLTPVPTKGYESTYLEVLNGGLQILVTKEGDKYSFNMPKGNITINATFEKITYSLTKASEHGTFTIPATANYGDTIEVTGITPDAGYLFSKIKVNGNTISGTTFTMPAQDTTVTVEFKANEYDVSKINPEHGKITLSKTTANYGDTITVTVTPDAGYTVSAIKVNGTAISGNSFVVTENSEVTVELTANQYLIAVSSSENGSVIPNKTTAIVGEIITLTISPNATYGLESLTIKNGDLNVLGTIDGNTATFTMPAGNVTISATFVQEGFAINIVSYEGSNIYANPIAVAEGTKVYVVEESVAVELGLGAYICLATPQPGYEFSDSGVNLYWAGGDLMGAVQMEQGPNGEDLAYFVMPAGEVTFDYECRKKTVQITKGETVNGTFDLSVTEGYYGDSVEVTVYPNEGYELDQILVNGTALEVGETSFSMPGEDVTVTVTFKQVVYTIERTGTSDHGTFEIQDTATYGEEVVITSNPEAGYEATYTVMCGETPIVVTDNKFTMPAGNVTISVNYSLVLYTITIDEESFVNGSFTASKTTANYNDEITITVAPDDGYSLKAISVLYDSNGDGIYETLIPAKTANENEYVFNMIAYNVEVRVDFGVKSSIAIVEADNGTVETDVAEAFDGDTVTITTIGNTGYGIKSLKVNSGAVEVTKISEGVYTFTMPANAVTITYEFEGFYTLTSSDITYSKYETELTITSVTTSETSYIIPNTFEIGGTTYTVKKLEGTFSGGIDLDVVNVVLPSTLTAIYGAFKNCTDLTSITIPNSVTSIDGSSFNNCSSLKSIVVEEGNTTYTSGDGANCIIEISTNKLVAGCKNTIIPNNVTSIGYYAFSGHTGLTSITIPSSVTSIGGWAFQCTGLTSIAIPNGVKSIEISAFLDCTNLASITIPSSVTSISNSAFTNTYFYNNAAVGNLYISRADGKRWLLGYKTTEPTGTLAIPSDVIGIADSAFFGCTGLTSITIPNGVTIIGEEAFLNTGLTSITIPNSVTTIGASAFSGCKSLTSVTIGNGITSIENSVFSGCTNLTSITIPDSVTSISDVAFSDTSLTSITFEGTTPPTFGNDVFYNCTSLTTIYVPTGTKSAYVTALGSSYASKIVEKA